MRLWSLHPSHLDRQGLLAVWREALLAQQVLNGGTRGYRHHPQLLRFRETEHPQAVIATYLTVIADDASRRGYRFDRSKIPVLTATVLIPVTQGQIDFERQHLHAKLSVRDPQALAVFQALAQVQIHPLFTLVPGPIALWERV